MQKRFLLITLAVLIPIALAYVFARYAIVTGGKENTTVIVEAPRKIPQTRDDAITMTEARLKHLQSLTQEQWDQERKTIPSRRPPERIADAVARAQLRLDQLWAMSDEDWKFELARLKKRDGVREDADQEEAK